MSGLYEGIGVAIMLAIIFFKIRPLITVVLINELRIFRGFNGIFRNGIIGVTFLSLMALTLFIIRAFPYSSLDGFLVYNMILIVAWIIHRIKKNKRPAPNKG